MDTTTTDTRELRGTIYLARLRLARLEGAWPEPAARDTWQRQAVAQARRTLASLYREARMAGLPAAAVRRRRAGI